MPGMNSGLDIDDPAVVAAFRSALLHQGLLALLVFAVLSAAWLGLRAWSRAGTGTGTGTGAGTGTGTAAGTGGRPCPRGWLASGRLAGSRC